MGAAVSPEPVAVVLFDVGNVIVRASHPVTYAILDDLGVPPNKAPLFFRDEPYGQFARGRISPSAFANEVCRGMGVSLSLEEVRWAHDAHIYGVDREVVMALRRLRPGVLGGFVTTSNCWQSARVRQLIRLDRLAPVVDSWRHGFTKTDTGAWPKILVLLGVQARNGHILLVDDDPLNIVCARRVGLQTYSYNSKQEGAARLREFLETLRDPSGNRILL